MKRKNLKKFSSLSLGLLLFYVTSCSTLTSIDKPVCVELNVSKGYCTTIISGKGTFVDDKNLLDGKTWFDIRNEMILVPIETWKALKKYLIKNCRRYKKCNANIDSWNRSMETIDTTIEDKK